MSRLMERIIFHCPEVASPLFHNISLGGIPVDSVGLIGSQSLRSMIYSKPRICRIQVDRQIYPSYAKIRLMRSEIKGFGTIVREILSEICEDPTYARFTVHRAVLWV